MNAHFDNKTRIWLLIAATGLIMFLVNPNWKLVESIKGTIAMGMPSVGIKGLLVAVIGMTVIWGIHSIVIGLFAGFSSVIILKFQKYFIGYKKISDNPDYSDEVFFYVLMTMLAFGLCMLFVELQSPIHYDAKKDLQKLCNLLQTDTSQEIQDICNPREDPDRDTPEYTDRW